MEKSYLSHHGVEGQKWGIQNGPPYPLNKTVFVSGSSKTQFKDSLYYRKQLPKQITKCIDDYIKDNKKIIVGDAPGIDRQVQDYLKSINYNNVTVYSPGKETRYIANKQWNNKKVDSSYEIGSSEWLAAKDIEMAKVASEGLAIILDEGSNATRNNIKRLIDQNKDVKIYQLSKEGSQYDKWITDAKRACQYVD